MSDPVLRDLDRYLAEINREDERKADIQDLSDELERDALAGMYNAEIIDFDADTNNCGLSEKVAELMTRANVPWSGKAPATEIREAWERLCRQWAEHEAPRRYEGER